MAEGEKGKPKQRVTVEQVEALLAQLPGVLSTRIVVNDWGAIEEVHVLATTERTPKQIVRDIESSLAARWGMDVDHKKISIAQVTGVEPTLPPVRLTLNNVQSLADTSRGLLEVTVSLGMAGDEALFQGRAAGPHSRHHLLRLAAQAAIDALNQTVAARHLFSLEDVKSVIAGGHEVALVLVALITPRGDEEVLVGASIVDHDPVEAVVRATLQATNRRVGRLFARRRQRHAHAGEGEASGAEAPAPDHGDPDVDDGQP